MHCVPGQLKVTVYTLQYSSCGATLFVCVYMSLIVHVYLLYSKGAVLLTVMYAIHQQTSLTSMAWAMDMHSLVISIRKCAIRLSDRGGR